MRRVLALLSLAAAPIAARAQGTTDELLQRAQGHYARLEIERALPLLRQVISPTSPFEVSRAQRVQAYVYLGAALAVANQRDSAVLYFRAAIERDPFLDLDPQRFTPTTISAFVEARRRSFVVAARPLTAKRVNPRTERLGFSVLTTHTGSLHVEIRPAGSEAGTAGVVLYDGDTDGLRDLSWNGLLGNGQLAPPGRYELVLVGQSRLVERGDSTRVYFDLQQEYAPLEDTLPALGVQELLPEQHPRSAIAGDFLKGAAVAGGAALMAGVLTRSELGRGSGAQAGAVAGASVLTGTVAFVYRQKHRAIPESIAENTRRRAARDAANAAVRQRNADKLAQTVLLIAPVAGGAP